MIVRILAGMVLALALLALWQRGSVANAKRDAEQATERAGRAEAQAKALGEALARDAVADAFTAQAAQRMDVQAAAITERLSALEGRTNDRPPVAAVCPSPDPEFVRESAEAAGRIRAAEGRLRDLRIPKGQHAD